MLITARRVKNLHRHVPRSLQGRTIVIGLSDLERFRITLQGIGFSEALEDGETILPLIRGPVSEYNAEGRYDKHRDQEMETVPRVVEWNWVEWHGEERIQRSELVDTSYKRYPRTFVPPPSVEFTITSTTDGERMIRTPEVSYSQENCPLILHTINLFLEIFGECRVFTRNLDHIVDVPVRRLNWTILPTGRMVWTDVQRELHSIVDTSPEGNQTIIWGRLNLVFSYRPEYLAIGHGGFRGYVIFAFPERELFILESIHYGNATYVFDRRWEDLSRMTKAEIVAGGLHCERIVHLANWSHQLRLLMELH
jgi:hypothetical protein